jgi:hypothetical protein
VEFPTENDYEIGEKLCYKLAEAIQTLPITSPLLHTLQLKLKIPFDRDTFPFLGCEDLLAAMNLIHLPVLTALVLSVDFYPDDGEDEDLSPPMDFSAFLASHPNLVALTLNADGTRLTEDVAFLPHLRSFKGSFEDSEAICDRQRQLDQLVITLVHRHQFELPSFSTGPLPSHLSLTKLQVLAVDAVGSVVKMTNELSPASLAQLVSSFPNLTHLDICISGRIVSLLAICPLLIIKHQIEPIPQKFHSFEQAQKSSSARVQETLCAERVACYDNLPTRRPHKRFPSFLAVVAAA